MPQFEVEEIRKGMDDTNSIRNVAVVSHIYHGKTSMIDSLVQAAGIISADQAGEAKFMDSRLEEKERGTIKTSNITLYFEQALNQQEPEKKTKFVMNLVDTPGHVDFSFDVTAATRLVDGAVVVVDASAGVCVGTESVVRTLLDEKVVPILFLNKIDRLISELKCTSEEIYNKLETIIESVNENIHTFQKKDMPDLAMDPLKGQVVFGSGQQTWGFSVPQFAKMYQKRFGGELDYWLKNLCGSHFFNATKNVWTNKQRNEDGTENARGFCMYILDPIMNIFKYIAAGEKKKLKKTMEKLAIPVGPEVENEVDKKLTKTIMNKFMPLGDSLLDAIFHFLPSPVQAQKYRAPLLFTGPAEDAGTKAIQACSKDGPLVASIIKMVPTADNTHFYALCRVLSGTVATGQKVNIMGTIYEQGKKSDLYVKNIQRTVIM